MAGRFLWIDALMPQTMRALAFGALALAAINAKAEAAPPSRIVSINLCADELLIALADPRQIAALSPYATDPNLSFVAEKAAKFRHDAADAETVVDIGPDLVLAGRFTKLATRAMLTRLGYRIVLLDAARSIDQSVGQIREVAAIVGHPDRGEALIAEIENARARASAASDPSAPSAAVYQRRGYVTGAETLTGELLATVGLANKGGELAGETGRFVPLERLVVAGPDYLVVAAPEIDPKDQGTALLAHPALAALYPPEKRIVLPEKLTVCAGPSLPAALDWLAEETARIAAER
jgi:iron complex transport system substrate-binding protein